MKRPFFRTFFITVFHHRSFLRRRIVVPSFGKTFSCLPNYNYLFVSFLIRFSMNNPGLPCGIPRAQARTTLRKIRLCARSINPALDKQALVGLSGLEPPTSRLSGGCSNQLSYKPVDLPAVSTLVEMMGFEPMTPCLQGRCSPN